MTLSITTFCMMTLSISDIQHNDAMQYAEHLNADMLSFKKLSIKIHSMSIMLSIKIIKITTFCKMTLSISDNQHNDAVHYDAHLNAACRILFIVKLSVVMLSVVMLNVIMLSVLASNFALEFFNLN